MRETGSGSYGIDQHKSGLKGLIFVREITSWQIGGGDSIFEVRYRVRKEKDQQRRNIKMQVGRINSRAKGGSGAAEGGEQSVEVEAEWHRTANIRVKIKDGTARQGEQAIEDIDIKYDEQPQCCHKQVIEAKE